MPLLSFEIYQSILIRLGTTGVCSAPTTLNATTNNTLFNALTTSPDTNVYIRDINLRGINCSASAGVQIQVFYSSIHKSINLFRYLSIPHFLYIEFYNYEIHSIIKITIRNVQ